MGEFTDNYNRFLVEFGKGRTMVLSSAVENKVTSRMMSIVQYDGFFYFQTDKTFRKYQQMIKNPQVALCIDNIQIEGLCEELGSPMMNPCFCDIYRECFRSSYQRYSALKNERLFVVKPIYVARWRYIEGIPFMEMCDIERQVYKLMKYEGI